MLLNMHVICNMSCYFLDEPTQSLQKLIKSKLQDGMKNDRKYPNCEMEPKLAKKKFKLRDGDYRYLAIL